MVLHIFLALLLLLIPAGALFVFDRSLLQNLGIAVGRMAFQLLALCLIVWALVKYDNIWLSLLWLLLLSVVSGVLALRRMKLPMVKFLLPVSAGLLVSALVVGAYLLWACLPAEKGFGARWFVPVMALLVGQTLMNSNMSFCVVMAPTICKLCCPLCAGPCSRCSLLQQQISP